MNEFITQVKRVIKTETYLEKDNFKDEKSNCGDNIAHVRHELGTIITG